MKEWVIQKLEKWKQRNINYYKVCFSDIDNNASPKFNWGAFLFGSAWMSYRKMYSLALIWNLSLLVCGFLHGIYSEKTDIQAGIAFMFLAANIILCHFVNKLYYKTVKSKIEKGYHQFDDYNPVALTWSVIVLVGPALFSRVFCIQQLDVAFKPLMGMILILVQWGVDYIKFHKRESPEPIKISEESVSRYLNKANHKCVGIAFCILVLTQFLPFDIEDSVLIDGKNYDEVMKRNLNNKNEIRIFAENLSEEQINKILKKCSKLKKLLFLNCSGCNLKTLPAEIGNLSKLKCLDISGNDLQTLPDELFQLENLMLLNACKCGLRQIPTKINKLRKLRFLLIGDNQLTTLPDEMKSMSKQLKILDIHGNKFRARPSVLSNFKKEQLFED